jgi:sugar O-acyltransferase (sialic acid O-acetyltransferase NeuD family)
LSCTYELNSSNIIVGVYGASGFGKEVLPLVRQQVGNVSQNYELVFIDDYPSMEMLSGCKVITYNQFLDSKADKLFVVIAIADGTIREKLATKCFESDVHILDVQAENVVVMDNVEIGMGSILSPFVTLTSDIRIGNFFQANIYSYVAHDCVIGDYVTFAPSVQCNGNIEIGDYAYLGTGAIIKQGKPGRPLKIGRGAVVGAGSVVTKNVPDGMTVFGNPAIEFTKENIRRRS